jgi:hypothetical protein
MRYTITQAAVVVGKGRSTVHRAVKDGRLSAQRGDDGTYYVDASELARVFHMTSHDQPKRDAVTDRDIPSETEVAVLRKEVEMLTALLDREREVTAEQAERLRQEQEERRNLQRQLAAPVQPIPEATEETPAAVRERHRRVDESEALIRTLITSGPPALQTAQRGPSDPSSGTTTAGPVRGFLGRLLGLGRGALP